MSGDTTEPVSRPALGPLFVAAVCGWVTAILVESISWCRFAEEGSGTLPLSALIACVLATLTVLLAIRSRQVGLVCTLRSLCFSGLGIAILSCTAIAVCSSLYWQDWAANVNRAESVFDDGRPVRLELTSDPAQRSYGLVSNARLDIDGHMVDMRLVWPDSDEVAPLGPGHYVLARGHLSTPKPDEGGRWNHQNGYAGMLSATSVVETDGPATPRSLISAFRDESFERVRDACGDEAGLLAGVLLGNRTLYANTELEQSFKTTGLAHLMAVSGTHLALVTMLVSVCLKALRLTRVPRAMLTLAMLLFYVALTCFAASAIRACVMCAVALVLGSLRRRKHVLSGLALCVFVFIGLNPPMAFSLGFALSALSVCGLVVFEPLFELWTVRLLPARLEKVSSAFAATLSAMLMTLPVTVPMFAQLPLVSPLANILAAPFLTVILTVGLMGVFASALVPALSICLLKVSACFAGLCSCLVRALSEFPFACIPLSAESLVVGVVFAVLLVALWVVWPLPAASSPGASVAPRHRLRAETYAKGLVIVSVPLVLVLAIGFGVRACLLPASARVVMLDVGQGDCMLIESGGHHVLVDTGEFGDVLQRGLARQGVTHLDAVILTHKDADHCGALRSLAGVVAVEHVFVHADLLDRDFEKDVLESARWVTNGSGAEGFRPGSELKFGEFKITMLAPSDGGESENADSLVNLLEYDAGGDGSVEARALLTGDAESKAIEPVVKRTGHVDMLKVPHHGSKDGVTREELDILRPSIAVIGVGQNNKYGHPKAETLALLEEAGTRVYRTDLQGDISLLFSPGGISVGTQK